MATEELFRKRLKRGTAEGQKTRFLLRGLCHSSQPQLVQRSQR